jgi:hypothetical protein
MRLFCKTALRPRICIEQMKKPIVKDGQIIGHGTQVEHCGYTIIHQWPKQWEIEIDGAVHLFPSLKDAKDYLNNCVDYDG